MLEANFSKFNHHKPSPGSRPREVPQNICARSVQPFWRLLDKNKQTNRQTDKQIDKPNLYIDRYIGRRWLLLVIRNYLAAIYVFYTYIGRRWLLLVLRNYLAAIYLYIYIGRRWLLIELRNYLAAIYLYIYREEMVAPSAKKLPCNHIFHRSCLRSWFQRQQTCPTCR